MMKVAAGGLGLRDSTRQLPPRDEGGAADEEEAQAEVVALGVGCGLCRARGRRI